MTYQSFKEKKWTTSEKMFTKVTSNMTRAKKKLKELEENDELSLKALTDTRYNDETLLTLEKEAEEIREKQRELSRAELGTAQLIACGIDYVEGKFDKNITAGSDLSTNRMKHAWIKFIETRGKGSFDKKWTGTEMTNGKGMNCLQNFNKITKAMISMYDVNTQEHEWLKKRNPDWE